MPGAKLNQAYLDEPNTLQLHGSQKLAVHLKLQTKELAWQLTPYLLADTNESEPTTS